MSTKSRIELFGEQLTRVKETIAKRSLDDLSTDKLFDLMMKLLEAMGEERTSLQIREEQSILANPSFKEIVRFELA